jgi:hypothetical protein
MRFSIAVLRPKFQKNRHISLYIVHDLNFKFIAKNLEGWVYFHILAFSQIWLNLPVDHPHFGYKTKIAKKKHCYRQTDTQTDLSFSLWVWVELLLVVSKP